MILGMSVANFTLLHTALSLVGILAGAVALYGMFQSRVFATWTAVFLVTTILTCVTGYFFPTSTILPSQIVGAITLIALAFAVIAIYTYKLVGPWRWIYVASAAFSLYLNVFVGVVQAFGKILPLKNLAPTQSEPPFVVAQAVVLLAFIAFGFILLRKFHPVTPAAPRSMSAA